MTTTTRKLAAIMFTDIAGYTALMGSDEDRAFEVLKKNREIHTKLISKYNGTRIKEMGDGMLISFNLASDAVRCAIEIQRSCISNEIPLKIGIHEGEMVYEGNDVLGDGVNIASRIQDGTEKGCIMISGPVYRDIKNKVGIETEFIGERQFKNVDDTIKIYKVFCDDIKEQKTTKTLRQNLQEKKSIVVLPFVNISGDPDQEYFCDGMTEEIINALSHIESLKVIARTSAFMFKDKHADIREIGKKLNVETILEGSVRKAGNRIRITAQLIKTTDGSHIWSDAYNRELKDIFAIQEEIAFAIVENLRLKLIGKEKATISRNATEDLEAYNLFLKGVYHAQMLSEEGYITSNRYYEMALTKDPEYAKAYVGLGTNIMGNSFFGRMPPHEGYKKAKEYIYKSLDIDNTLSLAHSYLGSAKMFYDWNLKDAAKDFKLALKLNPNSSFAHMNYSTYLLFTGNHAEAIQEAKLARELGPLSIFININYGDVYFYTGYFVDAIKLYNESIEINPNHALAHHKLGHVYEAKSLISDAIVEYQKADELSKGASFAVSSLACCYYLLGEVRKAAYHYARLRERSEKEYVPPIMLYAYHLVRDDIDQAYEWFEKAIDEHDSYLLYLTVGPTRGHRIPGEPRFNKLLNKSGLVNLRTIDY